MIKQSRLAVVMLPFCCTFLPTLARGADNGYHVLATYTLARPGKTVGIAVDSEARRLYVARSNGVEVLNADTGAKVGSVETESASRVVLAPEVKHGFVSHRNGQSVTMFDPATLKVLRTIKLPIQNPDAMTYDPEIKGVFVAGTGGVTLINADSGEVTGTVPLEGQLRHLASNGYGELFVAAEDQNAIHVVDTNRLKFLGDFPIAGGAGPTGLSLDPSGRRLFVACTNGRLPIIDTDIGFVFEELPIGSGSADDVFTFTPQGKGGWRGGIFVTSADGTLSLIRMNAFINYSHAGEVKLHPGIEAVAFDPKSHRVFVGAPSHGGEILVVGQ